jgi:hypothetical protein
MSNIGTKYQLEARVNIAGESSSYSICGCWIERMPGSTETYIAGSHSWVCAECANGIDQELALFAYRPEVLPRRRPEELKTVTVRSFRRTPCYQTVSNGPGFKC